jgi:hypothetical protein
LRIQYQQGDIVDLRTYFRKIRDVESSLTSPYVVVLSMETSDGGKPGVLSEVTRHVAAHQIAEGRSRQATDEEAEAFHKNNREVKQASDDAAAFNRMQIVVVPGKSGVKGPREQV